MKIRTLEVGALKSNCYLVIDESSRDCIIIDPGDDADYIQRTINDEDANPISIITTHGHFDHVLAGFELQTAYDIPFLIHKDDEFLLERMQSSSKHFTGIEAPPKPKVSANLIPKQSIKLGKMVFEILLTPGHSPGSISLYSKSEKVIFVGDLIFAGGYVGRTNFKYASSKELHRSIQQISELPEDVVIYPGHGVNTTIGEIKSMKQQR